MKRPIMFAAPILLFIVVLIIPLGHLSLGGISEKYLPPNNSVRLARRSSTRPSPASAPNR